MNVYADSLDDMSTRLLKVAAEREDQAVSSLLPLVRRRDITPAQIAEAVSPWSARLDRLRRSARLAARSAKELR